MGDNAVEHLQIAASGAKLAAGHVHDNRLDAALREAHKARVELQAAIDNLTVRSDPERVRREAG